MSATATYVYCLLHHPGDRAPSLGRAPRGLPATGAVRTLDAGDGLWLVVADAPLARYGSEPIERRLGDLRWVSACALAHEAVIEHVARRGTVVPMKLFTLFAGDERAVAHIRRRRPALARLLRRIAGRQEWGVRLVLDPRRALAGAGRRTGPGNSGARSGTAFLRRKQAEQRAVRRIHAEAGAEAERVFERLARRADDARRRAPVVADTPLRLLLDAAFLVPAPHAARFRAAAAGEARRLAGGGYRLSVSGPWPPYTFVREAS